METQLVHKCINGNTISTHALMETQLVHRCINGNTVGTHALMEERKLFGMELHLLSEFKYT